MTDSYLRGAPADPVPFESIGDALARQAASAGDRTALRYPDSGDRLSFEQWYAQARRVAFALIELGVRPGNRVALLAENRIEWNIVQMAVALCGGVLVPINTHVARDDLRYVLAHSDARIVVTSVSFRSNPYLAMLTELRERLPLEHVIAFGESPPGVLAFDGLRGAQCELPEVSATQTAGLLYTSGTTGFPKGTLLTHGNMLFDAWQVSARLGIDGHDRWTSMIPLFHCAGCIMAVLGSLQRGGCYVGVAGFTPRRMFEVIEGERCTVFSGVPTAFLAMLEDPARERFDLSSLRTGSCGGADANPEILRTAARELPIPYVCNVYGQTESSTIIALSSWQDEDRFDTVGPVLDGCELRITHAQTGEILPLGETGQIEARGPMVMQGYHANEGATAETIDEEGWLKTGDLGYVTAGGKLCIAGGRLRDMIIRGGENMYPVEIENHLAAHPAVREVAVVGVPDRYYGEIPVAVVILNEPATTSDLRAHCDGRLARFKVPARWYRTDSFPQTASGKTRKVALQEMIAAGVLDELTEN